MDGVLAARANFAFGERRTVAKWCKVHRMPSICAGLRHDRDAIKCSTEKR